MDGPAVGRNMLRSLVDCVVTQVGMVVSQVSRPYLRLYFYIARSRRVRQGLCSCCLGKGYNISVVGTELNSMADEVPNNQLLATAQLSDD